MFNELLEQLMMENAKITDEKSFEYLCEFFSEDEITYDQKFLEEFMTKKSELGYQVAIGSDDRISDLNLWFYVLKDKEVVFRKNIYAYSFTTDENEKVSINRYTIDEGVL